MKREPCDKCQNFGCCQEDGGCHETGDSFSASACFAMRLALNALLEIEWSGNEKGTRCPDCYEHCAEGHSDTCEINAAIQALQNQKGQP